MAKLTLSNPMIPLDSIVLVTGANGLIASWVVEKFLDAGYRVRGTVRSISRCSWMEPFFAERHGPGRFEIVELSDYGASGAWDSVIKGVASIAAVAGQAGLDLENADVGVEQEFPFVAGLLKAAKDEPSVKSVVYTSSAWAAWTPDPTEKVMLDEWTYNEHAIRLERSALSKKEKGILPYMAFKALLEQRIWDWVRREKPSYTFNTILPESCFGGVLSPENQGIPSTCGMAKMLRDGVNLELVASVRPQRFIDSQDLGLLYVAALTTPGVNGHRLFAFGDKFSFSKIGQILKELEPEKKMPTIEEDGWDQTEVPNQLAESLVRSLNGRGWAKLEDSIADLLKSIKKLED
ncbi:NAD(P)-binding protein [Xylariaceae sp. AK1471]|nr:NAD(P)-binding protein [Xylariaceae sp. AK1471]